MEHYPISTPSRVLSQFLRFFHPMGSMLTVNCTMESHQFLDFQSRQVQCRIYDPDDVGDGGSRCSSPKPAASRPCAEVDGKEDGEKNLEVIEKLQDCGSVGDSVTYPLIPKGFQLNIWDIQISLVLLEHVLATHGHFYKTF